MPNYLPNCNKMNLDTCNLIEFVNPSGKIVFRVDGMGPDGKRIRANFKTEGEALSYKQQLEADLANVPSVPLHRTKLSPDQLGEAERAFAELGGKSLSEAVRFYLANYRDAVNPKLFPEALAEYLEEHRRSGSRPLTITNLRIRVGFLLRTHGERMVHEIPTADLEKIIHRGPRSDKTKGNDYRAIAAFFAWALKKNYCPVHPLAAVKKIKHDEGEPVILPLGDCRKLLSAAATYKDGVVLPYVALALFCGIRPTELSRLTWAHIDLENALVRIPKEIAKKRKMRTVAISENCLEWLLPHAVNRPAIVGKNWRRDFDAVKALAGYGTSSEKRPNLKDWTPDIMRHTAITMHFMRDNHEGLTASWAGNSPDIVHTHYKGLLTGNIKSAVAAFWNIRPDQGEGNIIKMA